MIYRMAYKPLIMYGPHNVSETSYFFTEPVDFTDVVLYVPNFQQSQASATSLT